MERDAAAPRTSRATVVAGGLGVLLVAFGLFGTVLLGTAGGTATITCTRDAVGRGECVVVRKKPFAEETWRFPVRELQGARLESAWHGDRKQPHLDGSVTLLTTKGPFYLSLDGRDDEAYAWREQVVKRIDAFARAGGPGRLEETDLPPTSGGLELPPADALVASVLVAIATLAFVAGVRALTGQGARSKP